MSSHLVLLASRALAATPPPATVTGSGAGAGSAGAGGSASSTAGGSGSATAPSSTAAGQATAKATGAGSAGGSAQAAGSATAKVTGAGSAGGSSAASGAATAKATGAGSAAGSAQAAGTADVRTGAAGTAEGSADADAWGNLTATGGGAATSPDADSTGTATTSSPTLTAEGDASGQAGAAAGAGTATTSGSGAAAAQEPGVDFAATIIEQENGIMPAAATFTLSGTLANLGLVGNVRVLNAYVHTNIAGGGALIDPGGAVVQLGTAPVKVTAGAWSVDLISTAATGLSVVANTLRYELVVKYVDLGTREERIYTSGWFAFTADADLADLALNTSTTLAQTYGEALAARITELEEGGVGGGSSSLIVVSGGTVDLPNDEAAGFLIGYKVTATTVIEGMSFTAGSYVFERDTTVASGWTYRTIATSSAVIAAGADGVLPVAGTLAASAITETGFTLTVTGASDAVALAAAPYAFSTDNGSTWTAYQSSAVYNVTGKTASTAYQARHRVKDAAGNVTTGTAITVTTTAHVNTYAEAVVADAPTHFWPLDGSGTDVIAGNNLALSGGAAYGAGIGDGSGGLVLATGTDKASGTYISALTSATSWTMECVMKLSVDTVNGNNWRLMANNGGAGFAIYNDGGAGKFTHDTGVVSFNPGGNSWTNGKHVHVAFVWTGTNCIAYINGVSGGSFSKTSFAAGSGSFILGGNGFVGTIDGAAVYINKVLTAGQILAHTQAAGRA